MLRTFPVCPKHPDAALIPWGNELRCHGCGYSIEKLPVKTPRKTPREVRPGYYVARTQYLDGQRFKVLEPVFKFTESERKFAKSLKDLT